MLKKEKMIENVWLQMLVIFTIAFLVRMIYLIEIYDSPVFSMKIGDAGCYDNWAQALAKGNWVEDRIAT